MDQFTSLISTIVRLAMRSLSLLALLLFSVVIHTTVSTPPPATVPNRTQPYLQPARSPRAIELLGPDGGKRTLKSFAEEYLTEYNGHLLTNDHLWHIERINDNEIALKSRNGLYIKHGWFDWGKTAVAANEWEMLTPVKNDDGSWSFKSRWNKWMSAEYTERGVHFITFESEKKRSEYWWLEPWY
ncbi:hypothetical protein PRIPAC_73515 [Pristionchus pacificus]|uniref:Uncharacterized protein n=1 Tax=Pristionchus pacificus TaxID=54126 RepID=A0A2A6C730_PRIPA|nr:hypothetical protein PRIPAC_73515 [Pristionchus pacificus]|eukprot:PDM74012.1 hypothetical protein PRIPAC_41368 [Pristionchus pacificus]